MNFINLVAPSAGMSGMVVFYSDAQKNGHSTARIMVGSALFLIFDYCGLLTIIFFGLIILAFYQVLWAFEIFAFILFFLFVTAMISVVYLASRSEERLSRLLLKITRFLNHATGILFKKKQSVKIESFVLLLKSAKELKPFKISAMGGYARPV